MRGSFFFVTSEVEFQEATEKGARIFATFMELNKISGNDRIYRIEEGARIAKSLIGKPIRFGADWLGKHIINKNPIIGKVEQAFQEGSKIKGVVRIWNKDVVAKLKKGIKFLFSVGGVAQFGETIRSGAKVFTRLWNAVCTHLQLLPNDPSGAGFPTAKMHKIIEINESVMLTGGTLKICGIDGECRILNGIKDEYEYEEAKRKTIRDIAKQKAINRIIAHVIVAAIKEPLVSLEEEN